MGLADWYGTGRTFDYRIDSRGVFRVSTDGSGRLVEEFVRPLRPHEQPQLVEHERQRAEVVFMPVEEPETAEERRERILELLADEGPLPSADIAARLYLLRQDASNALASLRRDGRIACDENLSPPRWRLTVPETPR